MTDGDEETFEYQRGPHRATFVVIERRLPEHYERTEPRIAFWLRSHKISAVLITRRARGRKQFTFYEQTEDGRVLHYPAERIF